MFGLIGDDQAQSATSTLATALLYQDPSVAVDLTFTPTLTASTLCPDGVTYKVDQTTCPAPTAAPTPVSAGPNMGLIIGAAVGGAGRDF